jgi:hypothetical protein
VIQSRRWAKHVAVWEEEGCKRRKRPLGRSRPRWEDNIKIDLQGVR